MVLLLGIIMNLFRSQFLIIHIISTYLVVLLYWHNSNKIKKLLCGAVLFTTLVVLSFAGATACVKHIYPKIDYSKQIRIEYDNNVSDNDTSDNSYYGNESGNVMASRPTDQLSEIIILRSIYISKEEDTKYFINENTKKAFECIYKEVEDTGYLMTDNWPSLGHWQEMYDGAIIDKAYDALRRYRGEYAWDAIHKDFITIGLTLIIVHFWSFFICCMRLWGAGIMASIFYQKASIYNICILTTVLLLVFGIYLFFKLKRYEKYCKESSLLGMSILTILIFSGIISTVFLPLQRYLIYFQGFYYIGLVVGVYKLGLYNNAKLLLKRWRFKRRKGYGDII